ncbi:MAG: HAMP domain-containing histidine kinase [Bacteroidales bacterium]|nr:HAMP domain-containing histidine kinase [Bacteroidales bacterium]
MRRWFIVTISTIFTVAATALVSIQIWQIERSASISDSLFNTSVTDAMDEVIRNLSADKHGENSPSLESLDYDALVTSVNEALLVNGVDLLPTVAVSDIGMTYFYFCSKPGLEKKMDDSPFKYNIILDDRGQPADYYITLYFSDKALYLMKNSNVLVLMSIMLIVIIALAYLTITRSMYNQRKIDEMKTNFINNMTHELKTPISTIRLETCYLAENMDTPECDTKHHIGVIHDENERMLRLVEAVLRNSRMTRKKFTLKYTEIDINRLIADEVQRAQVRLSDANGSSTEAYTAEKVTVYGDADHLSNMISNLIDNAIKYSPKNPTIKVTTTVEGKYVRICIADNGIGISKEDRRHIFENFYRVSTGDRHDVKGFGIGLNYVLQVVKAHKGKVGIESEVGKGSTFIIRLPRA